MAVDRLPPELQFALWDKREGVPSADFGFGEALRKLDRLHRAVDTALLQSNVAPTAAALRERIAALGAARQGPVRAACEQARLVVTAGRKLEPALKKAPGTPKPTLAALAKAIDAADGYATQTPLEFDKLHAELGKRLQKLPATAEQDEDDPGDGDFRAFAKPRVIAALRQVRKNDADARPVLGLLVDGGKHVAAYCGTSVAASLRARLAALLKERGDSAAKPYRCTLAWEENACTFIGDDMPLGGFAKRLKEGLFDLTGVRYPVRVRRTSGEAEDAGGDTDGDADPAAVGAAAPAAAPGPSAAPAASGAPAARDGAAARFAARLAALRPAIRAGIDRPGSAADALKRAVDQAAALAGQKRFDDALVQLDAIEALLANDAPAPAVGAPAPAVESAAAFKARLAALAPALKSAGAGDATLQALRDEALARAKRMDFTGALALLEHIDAHIGGRTAAVPDAAATAAGVALAPIWADARDRVDGQIAALQELLRKTGVDVLRETADEIGSAVAPLGVALPAALLDHDRADPARRAALRDGLRPLVAHTHAALMVDRHVEAADTNPFGVAVTIRATLGDALLRLQTQLAG